MEPGDVTGEDVMSVLPFNNTVDLVQLSGHQILSVLEYNVAGLCPNMSCETVEFYQVSGMRLVFDIRDNNQVLILVDCCILLHNTPGQQSFISHGQSQSWSL